MHYDLVWKGEKVCLVPTRRFRQTVLDTCYTDKLTDFVTDYGLLGNYTRSGGLDLVYPYKSTLKWIKILIIKNFTNLLLYLLT